MIQPFDSRGDPDPGSSVQRRSVQQGTSVRQDSVQRDSVQRDSVEHESVQHGSARHDRAHRRRLERWWFVLVMFWSLCRIVAVWHWLDEYGVNPAVYALVDLGSSAPYALGSARTIGSLIDRRYGLSMWWGLMAAVSFAAPDVYIFSAGRHMPFQVYAFVGFLAAVAGIWAVRTGRRDVSGRRSQLGDVAH